jgi:glycosyltransferase involved in cell wall biosynthesis
MKPLFSLASSPPLRVALVGNSLPRLCGISTFTCHLRDAILHANPNAQIDIFALDEDQEHSYGPEVCYVLNAQDRTQYRDCAQVINQGNYDAILLQHEFGIFGGQAGNYIVDLLQDLRIPILTTFHTILDSPNELQEAVMMSIIELSDHCVLMSKRGIDILKSRYGAPNRKAQWIPHGIPDIDSIRACEYRRQLGKERPLLVTFGLLSPDKGLQFGIEAMAEIVKEFPTAKYVIAGATHPKVKQHHGEVYRNSLIDLTRSLNLENNVQFLDYFMDQDELLQLLGAMDYYVTPYLNPAQITSGTLAYALGTGKPIVSTGYHYAKELLDDGRGVVVPFKDPAAIADAVITLEGSPSCRAEMRYLALDYAKTMRWEQVGKQYSDLLASVTSLAIRPQLNEPKSGPSWQHFDSLFDCTGMIQHAIYSVPRREEGYCIDDNARALLALALAKQSNVWSTTKEAHLQTCLSFIEHAWNPVANGFRNFMSYDRKWLEEIGSEDAQGRTLWSIATVRKTFLESVHSELLEDLWLRATSTVDSLKAIRARSYALLGLVQSNLHHKAPALAESLYNAYLDQKSDEWNWFEQQLTYDNARVSQAMIEAGDSLNESRWLEAGLDSLTWLMDIQTGNLGEFLPIGSNGFYKVGCQRARFDQQPIEAWATVSACLSAYRITELPHWHQEAQRAYNWFLGANSEGMRMVNEESGACFDGLQPRRANRNCGAESTLAALIARLELDAVEEPINATTNNSATPVAVWVL